MAVATTVTAAMEAAATVETASTAVEASTTMESTTTTVEPAAAKCMATAVESTAVESAARTHRSAVESASAKGVRAAKAASGVDRTSAAEVTRRPYAAKVGNIVEAVIRSVEGTHRLAVESAAVMGPEIISSRDAAPTDP